MAYKGKQKPLPSLKYLNECFEPDFENGILIWRERPLHHFKSQHGCNRWNTMFSKKNAGCIGKYDGYIRVYIDNKVFSFHRILYYMYHKELPNDLVIDHINHDGADNRIENLRSATQFQNCRNKKSAMSNNKSSGIKNITQRYTRRGALRYDVSVSVLGDNYRGSFNTLEDALIFRNQMLLKHHKEYASYV
jgi:hypothetical protein